MQPPHEIADERARLNASAARSCTPEAEIHAAGE
jgi:hypothetical protein